MLAFSRSKRWLGLATGLFFAATGVVAFDDDDEEAVGPQPPVSFSITVSSSADTVVVSWPAQSGLDSVVATIAWNPELSKATSGNATRAVFTSADGLEDGVTVTASATAYSPGGSQSSSNTPAVVTDFFPWDEYYPTSLHFTRIGKQTFYNTTPNAGYESLTGVAYSALPCQGCHRPGQAPGTNGCESCHDTAQPGLGATVDATLDGVCGDCHGRQKAEAGHFSDYHRDVLGFACMDCHSMEDVHGDGNAYDSMLEDGAIDAACEDCHPSPPSNTYHDTHGASLDCSTCHMQGIVTCDNCHFEGQLADPPIKKARSQITSWMFLVNRGGEVHPANIQSLEYRGETFVAIAPYYAHTIDRNAVSGCGDCHGNAAVDAFNTDSTLAVTAFDGVDNVIPWQGVIPVPGNYRTVLSLDFLQYDPGADAWSFIETGPDGWHLLYGTPLSDAQLGDLN